MSHVYLLHIEPAFGHARHYTGYTTRDDVTERVAEHVAGKGAVMLRHATAAGCAVTLVRVWRDVPRKFENSIKGRSVRPLCPVCCVLWTGRATKESEVRNMDVYNSEIAKLAERVANLQTVGDSAITLINGLRERINQLITESDGIVPTGELQKLSSSIDVGTRALAAAVEANTMPPAPVVADVPESKPAEENKDPDTKPPVQE